MAQNDTLQSFVFENRALRGEIVHLNSSFQKITGQHAYPASINRLLGEALTCTTLLSGMIKTKGRLTVQFKGSGSLKLLTASATSEQHIRGLAQFDETLAEDTVDASLQQGKLAITFEPEQGKPYQGIVDIQGSHITQAVEKYFNQSEQLPTRLYLAADQYQAVGLLLQTLPSHDETEEDWSYATSIANTIKPEELLSLPNKTLLHRLYHADDIRLFDREPVMFKCTCSEKRCENAVRLLGKDEAESILLEKQRIVVTCEFCNANFQFDRVDVERLFKSDLEPPESNKPH